MDWTTYLPQFGIFAPTMALAWWVIRNKDKALSDAQARNAALNDAMLKNSVDLTRALTELTTYLKTINGGRS